MIGCLGLFVLAGTVNPQTLHCYSTWIRFKRPQLVQVTPSRPWSLTQQRTSLPLFNPNTPVPLLSPSTPNSAHPPQTPQSAQTSSFRGAGPSRSPPVPTISISPPARIWNPPAAIRVARTESEYSYDAPIGSESQRRSFYFHDNDSKHTFGHKPQSSQSTQFPSTSTRSGGSATSTPQRRAGQLGLPSVNTSCVGTSSGASSETVRAGDRPPNRQGSYTSFLTVGTASSNSFKSSKSWISALAASVGQARRVVSPLGAVHSDGGSPQRAEVLRESKDTELREFGLIMNRKGKGRA